MAVVLVVKRFGGLTNEVFHQVIKQVRITVNRKDDFNLAYYHNDGSHNCLCHLNFQSDYSNPCNN